MVLHENARRNRNKDNSLKKREGKIHDIILYFLCMGEICSLSLREEHELRVSESGIKMKTFGPKEQEITGNRTKITK